MASKGNYGQWAAKADRPSTTKASPPAKKPPYPNVKADDLTHLRPEDRAKIKATGKARVMPGNPPAWVKDEGTWEKAKAAVQKYWDNYDEPWAVVSHVFQQMGGS